MKRINLNRFRGDKSTLFTGRSNGEKVRDALSLHALDKTDEKVVFVVPEGTTSFNPSFFLGLLFKSIEELGISDFENKYSFEYEDPNPKVVDILKLNIADGMRNARNTIEGKIGFRRFLRFENQ